MKAILYILFKRNNIFLDVLQTYQIVFLKIAIVSLSLIKIPSQSININNKNAKKSKNIENQFKFVKVIEPTQKFNHSTLPPAKKN